MEVPKVDSALTNDFSKPSTLTASISPADNEYDPSNPLNFSDLKKWIIIIVIANGAFCVTCCACLITVTYDAMMEEFNSPRLVVTLGLTLFVAGSACGPLFLAPLSEFYGRRWIYLISFAIFVAFTILTALAQDIATLLVARGLAGISGSAFLSVTGGSVSDVFRPSDVGNPMAVVSLATFIGPIAAPVIGNLMIGQDVDWRWIWYFEIIWTTVLLLALFFLVPETYAPRILQRKAVAISKEEPHMNSPTMIDDRSLARVILRSCTIPFQLLALEPMCLFLCIWNALVLGVIYAFFSAFPIVFKAYEFSTTTLGTPFIGIGVGQIIGACTQPLWNRRYQKVQQTLDMRPPPEVHLVKGMIGGLLAPLSLVCFAFTINPSVHWIVPILATVPFGLATVWIFTATLTYLVDAFRPVAASSMAANSFLRAAFAASFPLFTVQMYDALGTRWASLLCAGLIGLLAPLPFLLYCKGAQYRGSGSRFAQKSE